MIRQPEPFLFEEGSKAIILLHAYASSSNDVRLLARGLQKLGYTVYAPIFTGHATGDPCDILTKGSPEQWWRDTQAAIALLQQKGYDQISVFGLSLGGVFATHALEEDATLLGGGTFSSPVVAKGQNNLVPEFLRLAELTYRAAQVSESEMNEKLTWIKDHVQTQIDQIRDWSNETANHLDRIKQPFFVAQGGADELINADDGQLLAQRFPAEQVSFHFYEDAGHVITVNTARKQLEADLTAFLSTIYQ